MRFDKLADWLAWQEQLHPVAIELGLERVQAVFSPLFPSPSTFAVVTVAGTNGKGSSVAMLEAILRAAGYRVGAYTSPHLQRYNERIRIGGQLVSDAALCRAFARVDQARGDISLSYFEFGTLAAMDIFYHAAPDIVLLEVGMGGRLDAVNVMDPDVALVTAIGLDHIDWLGTDRETIGREKAGIFRAARPAVCSDPRPPHSLVAQARAVGAELHLLGCDYNYAIDGQAENRPSAFMPQGVTPASSWTWQGGGRHLRELPMPALIGEFQLQNAAGVLMTLACLPDSFTIERQAIAQGLSEVCLPGRFQQLPGAVPCILDVAHNRESAAALATTLAARPCRGKTYAVVAMLRDKDIVGVLAEMQRVVDEWYPAALSGERAAPVEQLRGVLESQLHCPVAWRGARVRAAYQAAVDRALPGDRIVVFGSFYTVAEVIHCSGARF